MPRTYCTVQDPQNPQQNMLICFENVCIRDYIQLYPMIAWLLCAIGGRMGFERISSKVLLHTWGPSGLLGLASLNRRLDPHPAAIVC